MKLLRVAMRWFLAGTLATAGFLTLRLGYADWLAHTGYSRELRRATELAPGNAWYKSLLGWALKYEQGNGGTAFRAAVALNPRDSRTWLTLGLDEENAGRFDEAEKCLLRATDVDRQYEPRWTLLNFYFRRGNQEEFRKWGRAAAEMVSRDSTALFRLFWEFSSGDHGGLLPDDANVLTSYLWFLLSEGHLEEVEKTALRLVPLARLMEDRPALLAACDRLVDTKRGDAGLRVWSGMCKRGLTPYAPPAAGAVTNGGFEKEPLPHGFDWRVPEHEAVASNWSAGMMRFSFSGKEPEGWEVAWQAAPVLPGTRYRLRYRYWTSGIAPRTGLRWRVFDLASGAELSGDTPHLSSEEEKEEGLGFETGEETRFVRVVLWYGRELGTTRIEGTATLAGVRMEGEK